MLNFLDLKLSISEFLVKMLFYYYSIDWLQCYVYQMSMPTFSILKSLINLSILKLSIS